MKILPRPSSPFRNFRRKSSTDDARLPLFFAYLLLFLARLRPGSFFFETRRTFGRVVRCTVLLYERDRCFSGLKIFRESSARVLGHTWVCSNSWLARKIAKKVQLEALSPYPSISALHYLLPFHTLQVSLRQGGRGG